MPPQFSRNLSTCLSRIFWSVTLDNYTFLKCPLLSNAISALKGSESLTSPSKILPGAEGGYKDTFVTLVYQGRTRHHTLWKHFPWGTIYRWIIMQSFVTVSESGICMNKIKLGFSNVSSTWNSKWSNTYFWPTQYYITFLLSKTPYQSNEHSRQHYLVLNPI